MEETLENVLKEYLSGVDDVCEKLLKGLNSLENICLKSKMDFFEYRLKTHKMEYEINGISFRLHGKGCTVFSKDTYIDWDFGYRSRWCGIDPWKVATTLRRNNCKCVEYYNGDLIKNLCEQAVLEGTMFKRRDLYYFTIPMKETFEPNFPKDFDTLIIEHNGKKCSISRNKVIDRFIRKSNRISNQIDKNKNYYLLRFVYDGKVIYTVPYDDIGYPENAVKIMSDDILKSMHM